MPASPQWYQRIPAALAILQRTDIQDFDRGALEALLQVSRRDAVRILHLFGATRIGNALKITREELLHCLEAIQLGDRYQTERSRRRTVSRQVIEAEHDAIARSVSIPEPQFPGFPALRSLPETIRFEPGLLSVRHNGPEDLLSKLLLLARTICHDHAAFLAVVSAE